VISGPADHRAAVPAGSLAPTLRGTQGPAAARNPPTMGNGGLEYAYVRVITKVS
jgi:hypothetical protein